MAGTWRRLPFFSQRELGRPAVAPTGLTACCAIDCNIVSPTSLALADVHGVCHLLDVELNRTASFSAHDGGVLQLAQPKGLPMLISVGMESDGPVNRTCLRVWQLHRPRAMDASASASASEASASATCVRTLKVFAAGQAEARVTSCSVTDDATQLALGLADGSVMFLRCTDLQRDRFLKLKALPSLRGISAQPINAVHFCQEEGGPRPTALFVASLEALSCVDGCGTRHEVCRTLDGSEGAEDGCSCVGSDGQLAVGRNEGVYFYSTDERGPAFAFDGRKRLLCWHRSFLVVVLDDERGSIGAVESTAAGDGAGVDGTAIHGRSAEQVGRGVGGVRSGVGSALYVYDLKNKFVAFHATFSCGVVWLLSGRHAILAILEDGRAVAIEERDLATKLEALFRKNLYPTAVALAHSQRFEPAVLAEIRHQYAEHLHDKGDHDGAIEQYIHTLGFLEPSRVIRKYLEPSNARHLCRYLQALHADDRRLGSAEHRTLLASCVAKLGDEAALDSLVDSIDADDADVSLVDFGGLVDVCTSSGYYKQALRVATRQGDVQTLLALQLDGLGDVDAALALISTLAPAEAGAALSEWGTTLMAKRPARTTELLVQLSCVPATAENGVGMRRSSISGGSAAVAAAAGNGVDEPLMPPSAALGLLTRHRRWRVTYLERLLEQLPQPPLVWDSLLEEYLAIAAANASAGGGEASSVPAGMGDAGDLDVGGARAKALELMRHPSAGYSEQHALLLCAQFGFEDGVTLLYERMGLHSALLRHFMQRKLHAEVVRTCHRFGEREPGLWQHALRYLAALGEQDIAAAELNRLVGEVVSTIERERLLPPIGVLRALSTHPSLPFSAVRAYALRHVESDSAMLEEATRESTRFDEDAKRMASEMHELASQPRVFQLSKCSACHSPLELPTVHFLCLHSFHQGCLGDNDDECPCCAPQRSMAQRRQQQQQKRAASHDDFFKQLELSSDGFTTIASYFACGMFGHDEHPGRGA